MCPPSHGHGHVLDIVHAKILRKEKPARLAEQYHVFTSVKEH